MLETPQHGDAPVVQVDIVSDVMCPWCIVGYKQLEQALGMVGVGAYVRWHPFELNPAMPPEGQNLTEHITEKYGSTAEQSAQNRAHLERVGQDLGFVFNFSPDSRIVNSFAAHQLLGWAQKQGLQHPLKLALFSAHFTEGKDVSDIPTLLDCAETVGLDRTAAEEMLTSQSMAEETRAHQQFWTERGVSGVPSMVFDGRYMLTGAQGAETYAQMLRKVLSEKEAA
ncbi:DsbA family oxidoreductase [Sulfitobacter sp. M57]|uniref:DsbA family oxidoreductase n=1 Tax=unclassified Sulfitobacter TaxID=196795 RepID=UPI0023E1C601|nr:MULTISPECIES: DsbA family oxidoreductase [unclassified Sulfitobacter]MDF3413211.1 DsbA family oxidoreductase [Sulfitobacter sp. KE5]MDF3421506.1 DsbA family oxidoreductase [Sulfitobacter sp. KE43]MDF3431760.1 DsbA family oxidoreductase [Sulfitobacter sp. KE42]MDF3457400.1 DsbA family oxidoreductase [Sulfitobacter sp. S74]MDF3461303.1 DsbA family oxidoreductase [Sulfitobacter sp. Ks18]